MSIRQILRAVAMCLWTVAMFILLVHHMLTQPDAGSVELMSLSDLVFLAVQNTIEANTKSLMLLSFMLSLLSLVCILVGETAQQIDEVYLGVEQTRAIKRLYQDLCAVGPAVETTLEPRRLYGALSEADLAIERTREARRM